MPAGERSAAISRCPGTFPRGGCAATADVEIAADDIALEPRFDAALHADPGLGDRPVPRATSGRSRCAANGGEDVGLPVLHHSVKLRVGPGRRLPPSGVARPALPALAGSRSTEPRRSGVSADCAATGFPGGWRVRRRLGSGKVQGRRLTDHPRALRTPLHRGLFGPKGPEAHDHGITHRWHLPARGGPWSSPSTPSSSRCITSRPRASPTAPSGRCSTRSWCWPSRSVRS